MRNNGRVSNIERKQERRSRLLFRRKHVRKFLFSAAAALCAVVAAPSLADAAVRGYSTANVNMRSGPSTSYPAVTVIPSGAPVTIYGCMSNVNWCDVAFSGGRGWVSGNYVQAAYQQRRVYVGPQYYRPLGIPTVTFEIGNYWDRHYRGRDFYRDRDRWDRRDRDRWDRDRDRRDWDRDRDRERARGPPPATVTGIGKEIGLTAIAIATEIEPTETVTGMRSVGFRACPAGRILIRIMIAFLIAASC
jgi:uncharacterized protein YraI